MIKWVMVGMLEEMRFQCLVEGPGPEGRYCVAISFILSNEKLAA